jgi:hypothetical protein
LTQILTSIFPYDLHKTSNFPKSIRGYGDNKYAGADPRREQVHWTQHASHALLASPCEPQSEAARDFLEEKVDILVLQRAMPIYATNTTSRAFVFCPLVPDRLAPAFGQELFAQR